MTAISASARKPIKKTALGLSVVFVLAVLLIPNLGQKRGGKAAGTLNPARVPIAPTPKKYSSFSHAVKAHQIACNSCHKFPSENWESVRPADTAFPDITDHPKHDSCINCHRQQFFRGSTPVICSICHTNPGPRNSSRHPFPNPREVFDRTSKGKNAESDFRIFFPHIVHVDIVSGIPGPGPWIRNARFDRSLANEASCSVCHQTLLPQGESAEEYAVTPPPNIGDGYWLKKGTFKSSPIGHTTCFTCHSVDSGMAPAPSDCASCHRLGREAGTPDFDGALAARMETLDRVVRDAWKRRFSAGTFRHEFVSHAELSCSTCHDTTAMVTTDLKTRKVSITACNGCHITPTLEDGGALNFEIGERRKDQVFRCIKCHLVYGSRPIPDTHPKAIEALSGN